MMCHAWAHASAGQQLPKVVNTMKASPAFAFPVSRSTLSLPVSGDEWRHAASHAVSGSRARSLLVRHGVFDGLNAAIKAREACPPAICMEQLFIQQVRNLDLPEPLLRWFHPVFMAIVLFSMGAYGAYQGWMIRTDPSGAAAAKAKAQHPVIMGLMAVIFLLGSQGGLGAMLLFEKPLAESAHAVTGGLVLVLLTVQALVGSGLMANSIARTVHAFLGSGIMLLLVAHFVDGLLLGFSF